MTGDMMSETWGVVEADPPGTIWEASGAGGVLCAHAHATRAGAVECQDLAVARGESSYLVQMVGHWHGCQWVSILRRVDLFSERHPGEKDRC